MLQQHRTSSEMKRVRQGAAEIMERERKKKEKRKERGPRGGQISKQADGCRENARRLLARTFTFERNCSCEIEISPGRRLVVVSMEALVALPNPHNCFVCFTDGEKTTQG